jgi:hypothetical protein
MRIFITVPQECVGMSTDHYINIRHFLGDFHILEVSGVTDGDQNLHSFPFQSFGFLVDSFDFVKDVDLTRTGQILSK